MRHVRECVTFSNTPCELCINVSGNLAGPSAGLAELDPDVFATYQLPSPL